MLLICYPKWTTCKKAEAWLKANNLEYNYRDIKIDNPNESELKEWHKNSNTDIKKFFNSSGIIYKQMNLKDKIDKMTLDDKLELLSTDGMLLKRPLLITDTKTLVGFNEKKWEQIL